MWNAVLISTMDIRREQIEKLCNDFRTESRCRPVIYGHYRVLRDYVVPRHIPMDDFRGDWQKSIYLDFAKVVIVEENEVYIGMQRTFVTENVLVITSEW